MLVVRSAAGTSTITMRTVIEQNALDQKSSLSPHDPLLIKVFGGAVRACILTAAIGTGAWLGTRPNTVNLPPTRASSRSQTVQMTPSVCSGINAAADLDIPPDYSLIDVRPIGEACFALLKAPGLDLSPTLGRAGGSVDVFGSDGRLSVRLVAIERSNGQWEIFEYWRLPISSAIKHKAKG